MKFQKWLFAFSRSKPMIFQKQSKLLSCELNIIQKIKNLTVQYPSRYFLDSLDLFRLQCDFIDRKNEIATERDLEKVQKEIIGSFQNESKGNANCASKIEEIHEILDSMIKIINKVPEKLWEKIPNLSNLFREILEKNLLNTLQITENLLINENLGFSEQAVIKKFYIILRTLNKKKIALLSLFQACLNTFLSSKKFLLQPPDILSNFATAFRCLGLLKTNDEPLKLLLYQEKDLILKNSKVNSVLEIMGLLQALDQGSEFLPACQSFFEINKRYLDNKEICGLLEVSLGLPSIDEAPFILIANEIQSRILNERISPEETALIANTLKKHPSSSKTQIIEQILNKNYEKNWAFFTPQKIQAIFSSQSLEKIDIKFIDFLQKSYFPKYLRDKKEDWTWFLPILAFFYTRKLLHVPLLLDLESFILKNKEKTSKSLNLSSFSLVLYLLNELGYSQSQLFGVFEDYLLKYRENTPPIKPLIHAFQVILNSGRIFSIEFFEKFITLFERTFMAVSDLEKIKIKEISTFLRSLALFSLISDSEKHKMMTEKLLELIKKMEISRILDIEIDKIEGNTFTLPLKYNRFSLKIEEFFKVYQFLFTFKKEFSDLWKKYDKLIDKLNLGFFVSPLTSNLQVDVLQTLKKLNIKCVSEKQIKIYFIDIFIEPNIVIEVHGHKHFSRNKAISKPRDMLKLKHLTELGYKCVEIPYFEFMEYFFTDFEGRKRYVWEKIKDHLPAESSLEK